MTPPRKRSEPWASFSLFNFETDSVYVYVNRRDWPLIMSQYMNMKLRMGRAGITNLDELPGSVMVLDITKVISWEDIPALGHDYLLRN